jgi:hypothetical protein
MFYCVYEGLSLTFVLQFRRDTDDTMQFITAMFGHAVNNLNQLYILTTFPNAKLVQCLTWYYNRTTLIINYSSTKANLKKSEYKFMKIFQLLNERLIKIQVLIYKNFYINE